MKNAKFLFALLMSSTLVACGGTNPTEPSSEAKTENKTEEVKNSEAQPTEEVPVVEKEAKLVRSYTGTFAGGYYIPAYNMVQAGYDNYEVDLFEDDTYVSNKVIYMDMYGTPGSVVITTTGSYAISENEDGDEIVSLSDAQSILYTTCGMFNFQYSWSTKGFEDSLFPVQLMGSASNSDSFEFFKQEYGFGYSFLTSDTNSLIVEVYLPDSYASHFGKEGSAVVNPFTGEAKAHEFNSEIDDVYIGTFKGGYYIPAYNMVQPGYDNYVITTFKDGTYRALNVKYMDMYGTIGNVSLRTEGQFTKSENEDGDLLITIGAAESILYTTCGMFNFQYSWQVNGFEDSLFPVQLMGSASNVDTLDLFKSEYGFEFSFLVGDTGAIVELNLPDYIASRYVIDQPSEGDTTETPAE